jgi:hypothetical protein
MQLRVSSNACASVRCGCVDVIDVSVSHLSRHMCRFFSGSMFNYPLLAEYKWFWRLDSGMDLSIFPKHAMTTQYSLSSAARCRLCHLSLKLFPMQFVCADSFILGPIKKDPFARMRDGKHVYGYMGIGREDDYLTTGWIPRHLKLEFVRCNHSKALTALQQSTRHSSCLYLH